GSVESASVRFLAVAIMVVSLPARSLWQFALQHGIHYSYGVHHQGVERITDADADQVEEFQTDDISRSVDSAPIGNLNQRRIGVGIDIRFIGISRVDPNVMTWFSGDEFALCSRRPFLDMGRKPIGIIEYERAHACVSARLREVGR